MVCILGNFACFFVVCCFSFLQNNLFSKNSFRNAIRVSNSLDPDQARHKMSGLIRVQTVCKGYQQTTLEGKGLKTHSYFYISLRRTANVINKPYASAQTDTVLIFRLCATQTIFSHRGSMIIKKPSNCRFQDPAY